jgi:hypothetical protein
MSSDALRALDELLRQTTQAPTFPPNSRYHNIPLAVHVQPDGTSVVYLRRRFVPPPDRFATIAEHLVVDKERPDHIAFRYFGDAELFWRLCDANGVMSPDELTAEIGHRIRITMPEGVPGGPRA